MHGIGAGAQGTGEGDVHPGFEIGPARPVAVCAAHRLGGGGRHDGVPGGKIRRPLAVEGGEVAVLGAQPSAESRERYRGEIEIPGGGEVGDTGLVGQVVEIRAERGLMADGGLQAVLDAGDPGGVGQAGLAEIDRCVGGVFALAAAGFVP